MSQAVRLSPRDPQIGDWYFEIGRAYLLQSRTDEAINWLEKARSAQPGIPAAHSHLAAAYAFKGKTKPPPPNSPRPEGFREEIFFQASAT